MTKKSSSKLLLANDRLSEMNKSGASLVSGIKPESVTSPKSEVQKEKPREMGP